MKLSNVVRIWDAINHLNLGELTYMDFEYAFMRVISVKNDIPIDICEFTRPGTSFTKEQLQELDDREN